MGEFNVTLAPRHDGTRKLKITFLMEHCVYTLCGMSHVPSRFTCCFINLGMLPANIILYVQYIPVMQKILNIAKKVWLSIIQVYDNLYNQYSWNTV